MYILNMNRQYLREVRERATLQSLTSYMAKDAELSRMLTTPIRNLPVNYRYLIAAVPTSAEMTLTLLDIAKTALDWQSRNSGVAELIISNGRVVGFVGYRVLDYPPPAPFEFVSSIVLFSCTTRGNGTTLAKDMLDLLHSLQKKYCYIEWLAIPKNPATQAYDKFVRRNKGERLNVELRTGEEAYLYRIPGINGMIPSWLPRRECRHG